jgi:hypothetical protein
VWSSPATPAAQLDGRKPLHNHPLPIVIQQQFSSGQCLLLHFDRILQAYKSTYKFLTTAIVLIIG